jgi:hypothetical protein
MRQCSGVQSDVAVRCHRSPHRTRAAVRSHALGSTTTARRAAGVLSQPAARTQRVAHRSMSSPRAAKGEQEESVPAVVLKVGNTAVSALAKLIPVRCQAQAGVVRSQVG